MNPNDIQQWLVSHQNDYAAVRQRLESVRNVVLRGRLECAANILERAYVNAVLSIQTAKDRHESAFAAYYASDKVSLKDAALQTVYGGHKKNWLKRTFENVEWESLVLAIRNHAENDRYAELLDVIDDQLVGVAHRKGAFMLAMSGMHEYMCIDSNVANYAGLEESAGDSLSFKNGQEYLDVCDEIYAEIGNPWIPPFIVQWAIYDAERDEHARHMVYFNEVLGR